MEQIERRSPLDRRRVPRGGRRSYDRPGRYPPVLVADAYDGAREVAARYLSRCNFDVAEAATGEQTLQRVLAATPHVILADWALPDMPTRRLCQWLEQSWRTRSIPVILTIGDCDPGTALPPVAGMLVKPFPLSAMLEEIRRVLRMANA